MATIERKNAFKITAKEQKAYMDGITKMIADGTYGKFVAIHSDMSHNMHTMAGTPGHWRFLAWHRAYLIHFEAELRVKEPSAFVPYWKWVDGGVPSWIDSFKPEVDVPKRGKVKNTRNSLADPITDDARIKVLQAITDYMTFTHELESDPHNQGHVFLGSPMDRVPTAPCDPMFWMHHGEVDRIWAEWQVANPGKSEKALKAVLSSTEQIMDPWKDTVDTLMSISSLGYSYV